MSLRDYLSKPGPPPIATVPVYTPPPPGTPRIQDIQPGPYYCGVLLCIGCGAVVARCHCGRDAVVHTCDSCPACCPEAPAVWERQP